MIKSETIKFSKNISKIKKNETQYIENKLKDLLNIENKTDKIKEDITNNEQILNKFYEKRSTNKSQS